MIAAVVLAAGASSRMGSPKAHLLASGAASFLDAILATLGDAGIEVVRIVTAPEVAVADGAVVNPDPSRGMLSSVQCGLGALPPGVDAVLLWPVDHPLVKAATVTSLIEAFRGGGHPVVVPVFEGGRGHPVLFAAALVPELLSADPAVGARAVVHAHADRLELAVPDPGVGADVDTPEDYRRIFGRDPVRTKELP
jgi:CTP:molybdopterin cytidylyltransferase MocA